MCAAEFAGARADNSSLFEEVKQLEIEFGDRADKVAALRADKLFRDGDFVAGARWLKIFRMIAMSHRIQSRISEPFSSPQD